jgi:prepilin-type N-terminal cleavage/methylation domain-containing protein
VGVTEGPSHDPERGARERGYSLVEVLVAIVILSLAILPMVGMFDAALRAATLGSNYDRARTLANEKLEEIRALPYGLSGGGADSVTERYPPATPVSGKRGIFTYTVRTNFVDASLNVTDSPPTSQMRVRVEVEWRGNTYTTTGFVGGA